MTLQLHRPEGNGGALVPNPPPGKGRSEDWRKSLGSSRWRVAPLRNSEMNPTSTMAAVGFWVALGGVTFVLLMLGLGSGFWH
jgi:hypothetical protein